MVSFRQVKGGCNNFGKKLIVAVAFYLSLVPLVKLDFKDLCQSRFINTAGLFAIFYDFANPHNYDFAKSMKSMKQQFFKT